MTFKWSPEATEAASRNGLIGGSRALAALNAAAKAQPIVALPPCPTCDGSGYEDAMINSPAFDPHRCPTCKGSGVERMIPDSELRAWISSERCVDGTANREDEAINDLLDALTSWLDEWEARP